MTRDLLEEIYLRLNREEAVRDLAPQDKGKYLLVTCPLCGKREAYLYKNRKPYIYCNRRDKCSYNKSLWDYMQETKNLTNQETLIELARLASYPLPDLKEIPQEAIEGQRERENIQETALAYFLSERAGALDYLKERGFSEKEIEETEMGYYPSREGLVAYLSERGYAQDTIKKAGLFTTGYGETHKLIIPYRDPVGRLRGFIARATDGIEPKYKFSYGVEKDNPFNLNESRGKTSFVVVEGFIDAIKATLRGVEGVVALGGASLTESQIETLKRYGAKEIILALDNDKAGQEGTDRALDLITRKGLKAFVMPYETHLGKDPDEIIDKWGIDKLKELIDKAESGARFKAKQIIAGYTTEELLTDRGREEVIEKALAYEELIKDPVEANYFIDTIEERLYIEGNELEPRRKTYHEKKAKEREEEGYRALSRDMQGLLAEGRAQDIGELIDSQRRALRAQSVSSIISPYTLRDLQGDIKHTPPGLKTGYESLDKLVTVPQEAITIIAGRPSHGKTTLLLNIFLNMVNAYQDRAFFFFSYEETRKQLGVKIINLLAGHIIDESKNLIQIENYIKSGSGREPEIEKAKAQFKELTESGRLFIIDEPYHVKDLCNSISFLKERYNTGAVFIDYIQKVKNSGKFNTRQLELQDTSETLLDTAKECSLPILLGAQLNRAVEGRTEKTPRLSDLREAGDIEQDANIVLGLYNKSMEKAQEEGARLRERVVDLNISILKNRNGAVNEDITLAFDRPILKIKDRG